MDDSQIVDLFISRDETAIRHCTKKFGSRLRAFAFRICTDPSLAEECENDTYLEAWNAIPPHEPRSYLFSFLAKITRCITLNAVQKRSAQKRCATMVEWTQEIEECIAAPDDVESAMDAQTLSKIVSDFLRTQSTEKANLFLRRYWFLDSVSEIAKRYGISESKVKTTLFRTRKALRDYLDKEGYTL